MVYEMICTMYIIRVCILYYFFFVILIIHIIAREEIGTVYKIHLLKEIGFSVHVHVHTQRTKIIFAI